MFNVQCSMFNVENYTAYTTTVRGYRQTCSVMALVSCVKCIVCHIGHQFFRSIVTMTTSFLYVHHGNNKRLISVSPPNIFADALCQTAQFCTHHNSSILLHCVKVKHEAIAQVQYHSNL